MTTLPGTGHLAPKFLQGFPATPEEARWTCSRCGVIEPKPLTAFGTTRYFKQQCACQIATKVLIEREERQREFTAAQSALTYSWLGGRWSDRDLVSKTFETFQMHRQPEAIEWCKYFMQEMKGTLVFYGTFGTGKTHLLAAICNAVREDKAIASRFVTAPKLFSAIQSRIQAREDYSSLIVSAIKTPLLVIDDIDKAKWSEFREEIYFEIVDERVKAGRPMAISTNRVEILADYV